MKRWEVRRNLYVGDEIKECGTVLGRYWLKRDAVSDAEMSRSRRVREPRTEGVVFHCYVYDRWLGRIMVGKVEMV